VVIFATPSTWRVHRALGRPPAPGGRPAIRRKADFRSCLGEPGSLSFDHGIWPAGRTRTSLEPHRTGTATVSALQQALGLGPAHLGRADRVLPGPDRAAQPAAPRGDRGQPGRRRGGRRQRPGTGPHAAARPAAGRDPGPYQGQHRGSPGSRPPGLARTGPGAGTGGRVPGRPAAPGRAIILGKANCRSGPTSAPPGPAAAGARWAARR